MSKFSHIVFVFVFAITSSIAAQTQAAAGAPQTARQALLEMFFSKTPGTLVKHLPGATVRALDKAGALATLQQYSMLAAQIETKEKNLETFETGHTLLSLQDPRTGKKFEMNVENDSLSGEEDNIEVSFETYKDQQPQRTPFLPRLTFVMKSEAGVWKLNEILFTARLPLADPDFLKAITDGVKAQAARSSTIQTLMTQTPMTQPRMQMPANNFGREGSVVVAMRSILAAEKTYSSTYRATGFTCTLSDLDGFGGGEPNEHQAMLISSGLASGRRFGYSFSLSGCNGTPATGFHLSAAPLGVASSGRRAYCADESGSLRYSADGNPATCFASGVSLP